MRQATVVRGALGGACLAAPAAVLAVIGAPDRHDTVTHRLTQVLGARMLVQACLDVMLGARTRDVEIFVDVLHAASMLPVAVRWPEHRRSALFSAAGALTTVVLDLGAGRRPGHQPGM